SQNKTLIRSATLSLIVFIGLTSLFNVYFSMNHLVNPFSYFGSLLPVTYIALAGIFLSQCKVSSNALR
ncbi:MAG: hypothetical protein FWD67_10495, partial [Betaproteobacteria bacterium]|nr:hypothetical protein [Betaproteobacteria bacterium]